MNSICKMCSEIALLTHWGQVTHTCVSILTIIASDNGLLPGWCQAIIWTNTGILVIRPLWTNFNEISIKNSNIFIHENAFQSVVFVMAAILLGRNVLNYYHISSVGNELRLME